MIGFSQVQFPHSGSSKVRTALYLSFYYALTIATIPTSIAVSLVSALYDAEIKTFLGYKKIKGGEKISKKEYWKIFGQGQPPVIQVADTGSFMMVSSK